MNNKSLYIALISFVVTLTSIQSRAQQNIDSLSKKTEAQLPIYPRIKYLSLTYDQGGESDYKVENTGRPANEGTLTRGRLQILANVPLWKKKGFTLSASEIFTREQIHVTETVNPLFEDQTKTYNFNNFVTTVNGTYISKLFNKPLISGVSVIVGSDDFIQPQKLTGLLTSMLIFQKNPNTRYTLGIAIIADPSTQIPAFPIITYWHRFADPRWEIDMILPSFFKVRRSGILGGWLSAGSEYNGFGYFLRDVPGTPKVQQNTYSEISFGLSYERIFAKNIMFSIEGGYKSTLQNRILEVYKKYNDASIKVNIGETPYLKAGLSWIIPNAKIKKEIQKATK